MAKFEGKDDGRTCLGCNGNGVQRPLIRYYLFADNMDTATVDFHDVCVGAWLMRHPNEAVQFAQGVTP